VQRDRSPRSRPSENGWGTNKGDHAEHGGHQQRTVMESERLVYGRRPVMESLRSGSHCRELFVVDADGREPPRELADMLSFASQRHIPTTVVARGALDAMTRGGVHQGVAARLAPLEFLEPADLLNAARARHEVPLLLALDTVQDPQNVGTLLRTADIVGAHGTIFPERRSAGLGIGVEKSSAGALAHVPLCQVTNLVRTLVWLKQQGLWVVGMDDGAPNRYDQIDLTRPVAVVVGGEGDGLRRLVREQCDELVHIPMRGHVESLNVGVAGSLMLYEVWRARGFTGTPGRQREQKESTR